MTDIDDPIDIPTRIERQRKAMTVKQLADLVQLSTKQIYELVGKGHIPSYRISGAIRFDPHHTAVWLRSQHS